MCKKNGLNKAPKRAIFDEKRENFHFFVWKISLFIAIGLPKRATAKTETNPVYKYTYIILLLTLAQDEVLKQNYADDTHHKTIAYDWS